MCKKCGVVVRRGNDPKHISSSALRNHLMRKHPGTLPGTVSGPGSSGRKRGEAGMGKDSRDSSAESGKRQATLQEVVPLCGSFVSQRNRAKAQETTTRVVGEMVAMNGLPLSFVESSGFRHLMKHVAPWYVPPSRRTFSRRVIPSLYESVRDMVRALLQAARGRKIHFTSNLWTGGQHGYLSLMAHWWQPNEVFDTRASQEELQGEPQGSTPRGYRVVLPQAQSMEDSAKGIHIAEVLKTALREWAPDGQVNRGFMVTDAGHNMINTVDRAVLQGIVCAAHKLHLVVGDAIGLGAPKDSWDEGTLETKALLDKCRKIVRHFSRSIKASRMMRERQVETGRPEHVLIQDVTT
ncbi:hypothetical protein JRQ81_000467 [Phrynocephalus forsythii]|uniref:BED-type domain-containing protein n=1 Tax=Phrynocephalus forsythii TaxID=171643 RepID=A0A9Q0Y6J1_9SAUR|nr:hypothetical protein JRQ81_000467 [Phrynocephalus forsythii]